MTVDSSLFTSETVVMLWQVLLSVISLATVGMVKACWGLARGMQDEIRQLRDNHVQGIERRVTTIEADCPRKHAQIAEWMRQLDRVSENLANLVGWMKKVDVKLDRIAEDSASLRADVAAKGQWIANLDAAHQRHINDREAHHG